MKPNPIPDDVAGFLTYDAETGELTWKVSRGQAKAGKVAGFTDTSNGGRVVVGIRGKYFYGHRIAWFLATGNDAGDSGLDHRDGQPSNNRLSNLRLATPSENARNMARKRTNTSGVIGVSWYRKNKKWIAMIRMHDGRQKNLGYFDAIEDAAAAYRAAAELHHGSFAAHLRVAS